MRRLVGVILCVLGYVTAASGATYYVDYVSGSDSNNGTATGTPFKHIPGDPSATGTANSTTPSAGDTICVKGGVTYSSGNAIAIKSSGTSGNKITYDGMCAGYGSSKAILSGVRFTTATHDYLIFRKFEMTGASGCIESDGNDVGNPLNVLGIEIRNNDFHDTTGGNCIEMWGFSNLVVDSNTFDDMNYDPAKGGELPCADADCCPDNGARGTTYFNSVGDQNDGLTFSNNTINDFCNTPIFIFNTQNIVISGNSITGWHGNDHSQGITIYDSNGVSISIHHNYYNSERHLLATQDIYLATTAYIYNNIIKSGVDYCWTFDSGAQSGTVYIVNNTCTSTATLTKMFLDSNTSNPRSGWDTIVRNNIMDAPTASDAGGTGTYTFSHNAYTSGSHGSETGAITTALSNIVVDTALNSVDDFMIKATFTGKDAGYDTSAYGVTDDYVGTSRPQGAGWDIGAYEYGGGSSSGSHPSGGVKMAPMINLRRGS